MSRTIHLATSVALLSTLPLPASSLSIPTIPAQQSLPSRLQDAVSRGLLVTPRPDLYVLGTVHIGSESAEEAATLIESVQPRAVVVEVPPSRVEPIRRRIRSSSDGGDSSSTEQQLSSNTSSSTFLSTLGTFPALAARGWSTGGPSGLLFATAILWGSLLKRSTTANEESESLPRRDEFAAAIKAADEVGAEVIAADVEADELIQSVTRSVSPLGWARLGWVVLSETMGTRPVDPVRRRKGETVQEWSDRRRRIGTARSSKEHGEGAAPELAWVLVGERDRRFADRCGEALSSSSGVGQGAVVCVVGLVHVDGIVEQLRRQQ